MSVTHSIDFFSIVDADEQPISIESYGGTVFINGIFCEKPITIRIENLLQFICVKKEGFFIIHPIGIEIELRLASSGYRRIWSRSKKYLFDNAKDFITKEPALEVLSFRSDYEDNGLMTCSSMRDLNSAKELVSNLLTNNTDESEITLNYNDQLIIYRNSRRSNGIKGSVSG